MKNILTLLFVMIVLTACSGEENLYDYTYKGEGEYWEAEYSFRGTEIWEEKDGKTNYSNENSDEFVLTYKGSLRDLSSLESLEYSYETSAGGAGGTREFHEPTTEVTFKSMGSVENGAKVGENEIIQVNVKWNDYEESFELHNTSE